MSRERKVCVCNLTPGALPAWNLGATSLCPIASTPKPLPWQPAWAQTAPGHNKERDGVFVGATPWGMDIWGLDTLESLAESDH